MGGVGAGGDCFTSTKSEGNKNRLDDLFFWPKINTFAAKKTRKSFALKTSAEEDVMP